VVVEAHLLRILEYLIARSTRLFYAGIAVPLADRRWAKSSVLSSASYRGARRRTSFATRSARISRCAGRQAKAIQELAGYADLTTTMRYMHLSSAARQDAIALLNVRNESAIFGDIVETRVSGSATVRNH
jgi:hypothetical protein